MKKSNAYVVRSIKLKNKLRKNFNMKNLIIFKNHLLELENPLKGYFRVKVSFDNSLAWLYFRKVPAWSKLVEKFKLGVYPSDFDRLKKLKNGKTSLLVNGYKIRWNPVFEEFQTSHENIGVCESFSFLDEAEEYCLKG